MKTCCRGTTKIDGTGGVENVSATARRLQRAYRISNGLDGEKLCKRSFSVVGASALQTSALDAAAARLGLLRTIVDDTGAAPPRAVALGVKKPGQFASCIFRPKVTSDWSSHVATSHAKDRTHVYLARNTV